MRKLPKAVIDAQEIWSCSSSCFPFLFILVFTFFLIFHQGP